MSRARVPAVALSVAGSDSGGGAGIQADLSTFHAFEVFGTTAITAVTAQNTRGVDHVEVLSAHSVAAQIDSVLRDFAVGAAKTGMLATAELTEVVAASLRGRVPHLVVDPVCVSKHGVSLLADDAVEALRTQLLPIATLVTPNLPEAARLTHVAEISSREDMARAAYALLELGPAAVLVKGGHLEGAASDDLLVTRQEARWYSQRRVESRHTHGTGCTLSAALTALLARGIPLVDAVGAAKEFVTAAIETGLDLGGGIGPTNSQDPGAIAIARRSRGG